LSVVLVLDDGVREAIANSETLEVNVQTLLVLVALVDEVYITSIDQHTNIVLKKRDQILLEIAHPVVNEHSVHCVVAFGPLFHLVTDMKSLTS